MATWADIASTIAAVTSGSAFAASIYVARFQGSAAARLEQIKWARTIYHEDLLTLTGLLAPIEGILRLLTNPSIKTDHYGSRMLIDRVVIFQTEGAEILSRFEWGAPRAVSDAANRLRLAAGTMITLTKNVTTDEERTQRADIYSKPLQKAIDDFKGQARKALGLSKR